MKGELIHFIVAAFMFGLAIYTSAVLNDICGTVMNCSIALFHTILGVMWIIIEKIDTHENTINNYIQNRINELRLKQYDDKRRKKRVL